MLSLPRKFAAKAAMVSILSLSGSQNALAHSAAVYVPPGSCAAEVALAGALTDSQAINHELTAPWVYRYEISGMSQSPREMIADAKSSESAATHYQTDNAPRYAALSRLRACAYRTAAANVTALVRRLAPQGLTHRVTAADCVREQEAFIGAYNEDVRRNNPRPPEGTGRELAAGVVEGVAFNHVMYNNGRGMTPADYEAISKPPRLTGMKRHDAEGVLVACLYGLAHQRGGGARAWVASNTPIGAPSAPTDPCINDRLLALNREITEVEARLDRFMSESSYVKAEGLKNATPMLQVTIWGLERNIAAVTKHCSASPMARERIADLESSLKYAKAACDQIQAGGNKCVAVEPEKVM